MNFGIIGLLFSTLIFFSVAAHADSCSQSTEPLSKAAADILKQTQIDAVKKDPRDFCQRNMLLRGLNTNKGTAADFSKLSTEDLKQYYATKILVRDPWEAGLIPTESLRKYSFLAGIQGARSITPNDVVDPTGAIFSTPRESKPLNCPSGSLPMGYSSYNPYGGPAPDSSQLKCMLLSPSTLPDGADAKKAAACAEVSFFHSKNCFKGLVIIENEMIPYTHAAGTTFMPMSLWQKILGSSKYDEGLRLAAQVIANRIQGQNIGKQANVFSDLQDAFQKSGMSKDDAKDAAFDILGLIGSSSSNLAGRFGLLGLSTPTTQALSYISAALPYMDYLKSTNGKSTLYSLPDSVASTCDDAKSYHFWLAAYLSRTLVKENQIDEKGAAVAAFVAEKGYQISRNLARKMDGNKVGAASAIITKPPYDPIHQIQRADLNFAAAGAEFGAQSVKASTDLKLNLDQSLVDMIKNSKVTSPVSPQEAKGMGFVSSYLQWEKEVSPDTALDAIQKQMP